MVRMHIVTTILQITLSITHVSHGVPELILIGTVSIWVEWISSWFERTLSRREMVLVWPSEWEVIWFIKAEYESEKDEEPKLTWEGKSCDAGYSGGSRVSVYILFRRVRSMLTVGGVAVSRERSTLLYLKIWVNVIPKERLLFGTMRESHVM